MTPPPCLFQSFLKTLYILSTISESRTSSPRNISVTAIISSLSLSNKALSGSLLFTILLACLWVWPTWFLQIRESFLQQSLFNSLQSEFSSQCHFHTLQLLNVPKFLFCRVVRFKTAPRGNFSHTKQIRESTTNLQKPS